VTWERVRDGNSDGQQVGTEDDQQDSYRRRSASAEASRPEDERRGCGYRLGCDIDGVGHDQAAKGRIDDRRRCFAASRHAGEAARFGAASTSPCEHAGR
jgi:hypothetical protein